MLSASIVDAAVDRPKPAARTPTTEAPHQGIA